MLARLLQEKGALNLHPFNIQKKEAVLKVSSVNQEHEYYRPVPTEPAV